MSQTGLAALAAAGVSVWLDDLDRARLDSGDLARLVAAGVRGVTTNPAIFEKAVSQASGSYLLGLRECAARGDTPEQAVTALTTDDVRRACDVLRPTWNQTGGVDGWVSIEVDPRLAHDPSGTLTAAEELAVRVGRPNVLIKVPATRECLPAITACLSAGISVNVTLIFSVERYADVLDAWLSGLEAARDRGLDVSAIHSVASFFVSRVDSVVDGLLDSVSQTEEPQAHRLRGRGAVANARLAWSEFQRCLSDTRWTSLAVSGAHPQRPLWASTGVKNPLYHPLLYVRDLVGPGCVNTMPEATLRASHDLQGPLLNTVSGLEGESLRIWQELEDLGISRRSVLDGLEQDGIALFVGAWNRLLAAVDGELSRLRELGTP